MGLAGSNGAGGETPSTPVRRILALGGHDFTSRPPDRAVCELLLRLAGERGGERPRICILPTASGDTSEQIGRFYAAFGERSCEPSDLSLFRLGRRPMALRDHLLSQDLIYVGGGSVISLLGVWRAHGIDAILREAWEAGVVLCGLSAGSLCWFQEAVTGFHGAPQRLDGLGLLPFSNCVHYEPGSKRRESYHRFLREGMVAGYAAEDGAALHFTGQELSRVISSRPEARGYRLDVSGQRVVEMRIATAYLGERGVVPEAPLPEALSTAVAP
jgi:dipeptidase E